MTPRASARNAYRSVAITIYRRETAIEESAISHTQRCNVFRIYDAASPNQLARRDGLFIFQLRERERERERGGENLAGDKEEQESLFSPRRAVRSIHFNFHSCEAFVDRAASSSRKVKAVVAVDEKEFSNVMILQPG